MPINVSDILNGEVMLCADADTDLVVSWNYSLTFNVWLVLDAGRFEPVDVRTVQEMPATIREALAKAQAILSDCKRNFDESEEPVG